MDRNPFDITIFIKVINTFIAIVLLLLALTGLITISLVVGPEKIVALFSTPETNNVPIQTQASIIPDFWKAPDANTIPSDKTGEEIRYGRELIAHTSDYLGSKGKVLMISNGMNCQNCHLDAGTKPFGNNYSAVASTYPKFRARSGAGVEKEWKVLVM